jgi:hypothetical protein
MKRPLFRLFAAALGLASLALVLELLLRLLPVADATLALPVNESNPVPRLQPERQFRFSKGWNFQILTSKRTNNYGFLSDLEYAADGPRPLVAVIGDSYVEAMQVPNAQALPGILATAVGGAGRVYGLGLSGTQLPTYLAYAAYARREFAPDGLVFTIIGNDFDESLLEYEYQPRNHYFVPGPDGELVLWRFDSSAGLAKRLARRSALIRYLLINCNLTLAGVRAALKPEGTYVANTRADLDQRRVDAARSAVDAFMRLLPGAASLSPDRIAFLVDGIRPELYSQERLQAVRGSYPELLREYFMAQARARGYEVIDLQPVFVEEYARSGRRFEFHTDNHWNDVGHRVAAQAVCRSALFSRLFAGHVSCPAAP